MSAIFERCLCQWCIFCLRKIDNFNNKDISLVDKFLKFASRYLHLPNFENEKDIVNSSQSCQDCTMIVENLCDVYREMKLIEMRLHWKLDTLKAIMTSAEKVQHRVKDIQENGNGVFENMKQIRRKFIRKSSERLRLTYPKIRIQRCDFTRKKLKTENQTNIKSSVKVESEKTVDCAETVLSVSEPTSQEILSPIEISEPFVAAIKEPPDSECDMISGEIAPYAEDLDPDPTPPLPTLEHKALSDAASDYPLSREANEQTIVKPEDSDENVQDKLPPLKSEICLDDDISPLETTSFVKTKTISITDTESRRHPFRKKRIITRQRTRKQHQILSTCNDNDNCQRNPSLKELTLKYLLKVKYTCSKEPCKSKTFRNKTNLENHMKLHGKFKCNFCSISEMTYAPDLVKHEIKEHSNDTEIESRCPRCDFTETIITKLVKHHLVSHLNLVPDQNTCPICNITLDKRSTVKGALLRHYQAFHNLGEVDLKSVKKCSEQNCKAYFRTLDQLVMHEAKIHDAPHNLRYECVDCKRRFKSRELLNIHRRQMHYNEDNFKIQCTFKECTKMFESEAQMTFHRSTQYMKKVKCGICEKLLKPIMLNQHMQFEHKQIGWMRDVKLTPECREKLGIGLKRCKINECHQRFYNSKDLTIHSQLHGSFECQFKNCNEVFDFAPKLALHELTHSQASPSATSPSSSSIDRTYQCPRCTKTRNNDKLYLEHFLNHLNLHIDVHTCPICDFVFSQDSGRKQMMNSMRSHFKRTHDLNKIDPSGTPYKCEEEQCSAYFVTKIQLTTHKNTHLYEQLSSDDDGCGEDSSVQMDRKKKFKCRICQKRFKSKTCVLNHYNIRHTAQKRIHPFTCLSHACTKTFKNQEDLDIHMRESGTLLICPTCGKSFHNLNGLAAHSQYHKTKNKTRTRPEKSFDCQSCAKKFKSKIRLQQHGLTHSGPNSWQFTCDVCGKKCRSDQKLHEHLRVHSKDKTFFVCEVCGAKYSHRHNLRIHVNNKHADVMKDEPKKYDKTNLTSRKGVKRKSVGKTDSTNKQVIMGRKQRRKGRCQSSTSCDSD